MHLDIYDPRMEVAVGGTTALGISPAPIPSYRKCLLAAKGAE